MGEMANPIGLVTSVRAFEYHRKRDRLSGSLRRSAETFGTPKSFACGSAAIGATHFARRHKLNLYRSLRNRLPAKANGAKLATWSGT